MADVKAKFAELCKLRYRDQAIWFMNGFWGSGINAEEANNIWDFVKHFVSLDKMAFEPKGEDGHELDQFWSAKFLEDLNSTLTASERKDALRLIDQDNNGKMSCIEYLVWKYKKSPEATVNAPQGDNTAAIAAAQAKVDEVQSQLAECERKITAQATAIEQQKQAIAAQNKAIAAQQEAIKENDRAIAQLQQKQQELEEAKRELQAARAELEQAVADLKAQEDAYNNKIKELEAKGQSGGVAGAKAKNELAQLKGEDPLPLRRAKITQEAAVRRVKKQEDATEEAKAQVAKQELELEETKKTLIEGQRRLEETKKDLERAQRELEKAKVELEQAYADLEGKMQDAVNELEEVKKNPGGGYGAIWWMERNLFEADKRLPNAKQRYDHKKPFFFDPLAH